MTRSGRHPRLERLSATRSLVAGVLALGVIVAGCKGPEQRAADHVARAEAILAAPDGIIDVREAALELRNAVALAPDDPHATAQLGRVLLRLGVLEEAIGYLEEASRLDPGEPAPQLDLARALLFVDPARSNEIATALLANDPRSVDALLVLAETDAIEGRYAEAHARIARAEQLAPEFAEIEWARARVYEAKIRALRLKPGRTFFDPNDFEAAARAYDAYVDKGGDRIATVLLSKAKLLAGWRGRSDEAMDQFRIAVDAAERDPAAQAGVLTAMATIARARGDRAALLWALERLTELEPLRVDRWEARVQVARGAGQPTQPILDAMLAAAGDDPRAHVVYARALRQDQGLGPALEHLRARIESGDDAAVLLSQMVQMQVQGGRPADGAQTLAELQRRHPDDIQTRLLLARRALVAGDPKAALDAIEEIAQETRHVEALKVLSKAQERLAYVDEALASIDGAIAASSGFDASLWARKAELLRRLGRPEEALAALQRLDWGDELGSEQLLLRARCEYDLGRRVAGRQRLLDLLEQPDPPVAAALELYERERDHLPGLPVVRGALVTAHERAPDDHTVLRALVDVDVALGQPNVATLRIKNALARRPRDPQLYAMRAHLKLGLGRAKAARNDAERALVLTPGRGDEALAVLIALAEGAPDPNAVIAPLERQRAEGQLSLHRKVLLGRMLARVGRAPEALELFEESLAEGARFTTLKTDTAYLLLLLRSDVERAELLAREAVAVPGDQVAAADVLGLVYMSKGLFSAAMYQFQFAAEHAKPPSADYLLHLGQALERMSRIDQARDAYARALEVDPQHVDSRAALAALGSADAATGPDPS